MSRQHLSPINEAPRDDGWILGLVGERDFGLPWAFCTRCDVGWRDEDGYIVEPTHWLEIPHPKPRPTGWRPAEGHIEIAAARGVDWAWRGWMVSVVCPDGTYDSQREPILCGSPEDARAQAVGLSVQLGLPVKKEAMTHGDNVIVLDERRK